MASSNRHWPSMFKSKPCNSHHQWQHDINPLHHQKTPYTSSVTAGFEERSPEPKPRWNPKPEQIRILEAIFNSGMVNPPRDEIRKIRAQLQEYGQVGDANVFYWFQNRKSRSKNKQRHLQTARSQPPPPSSSLAAPPAAVAAAPNKPPTVTAATSSSSSSDHSSGSEKTLLPPAASVGGGVLTSMLHASSLPPMNPAVYLHGPLELAGGEPLLLQAPQGHCLSAADVAGIIGGGGAAAEHALGVYPGLWSEFIGQIQASKDEEPKVKMQLHHYLCGIGAPAAAAAAVTGASTTSNINATAITGANNASTGAGGATTAAASLSEIQGIVGGGGGAAAAAAAAAPRSPSSTVFINEVAFEVAAGPLNVRDAFGGEAILLDHSGRPVPTDEWGITIHPLHHGASYYLV